MSEVDFRVGQEVFAMTSRPKHRAVKEIRNILTGYLLDRIDLDEATKSGEISIEDALQQCILTDPKIALEVQEIESTLLIDQTIMLATGLTYKELEVVKGEMFEDDYISWFDKAKEILGGDANSFFGPYNSGSTSKPLVTNTD